MKYFLIIYTVLYIILEIGFRGRFLDAVGVISNQTAIDSIDFVGRFISSLGLFSILMSYFKFRRIKYAIPATFSKIIVSIAISVLFFYGQKMLIESIAENTTAEFKKNAVHFTLFKNSLYFNKVTDFGRFPYVHKDKDR